MIKIREYQLAVGQGGFHFGTISSENYTFNWIFDCGTDSAILSTKGSSKKRTTSATITRELDFVATELGKGRGDVVDIDLLFLSHLDKDHINGIDLFNKYRPNSKVQPENIWRVKEVVIPFVPLQERIFMLCRHLSSGSNLEDYLDFYIDPRKYIKESLGLEDDEITEIEENSQRDTFYFTPDVFVKSLGEKSDVFWKIVPHLDKSVGNNYGTFLHELVREFGFKDTTEAEQKFCDKQWILSNLKRDRKKFIQKLKRVYKSSVQTTCDPSAFNTSSLCVYSGTGDSLKFEVIQCISQGSFALCHISGCMHFRWGLDYKFGWVLTGDADLRDSNRIGDFEKSFDDYKPYTLYSIPHHGSINNSDLNHLKSISAKYSVIEHGVKNKYGHPSSHVYRQALNRGGLMQVTENDSTRIIFECIILLN